MRGVDALHKACCTVNKAFKHLIDLAGQRGFFTVFQLFEHLIVGIHDNVQYHRAGSTVFQCFCFDDCVVDKISDEQPIAVVDPAAKHRKQAAFGLNALPFGPRYLFRVKSRQRLIHALQVIFAVGQHPGGKGVIVPHNVFAGQDQHRQW
ncbi:hypothetical protein SDC9_155678 [bioreactor metagenome]|uniref:Uncharacterized protein n=1 Tax=bioreactor metagenome TaxID=1076179 RepID=A0A645F432_9ZZZZ